VIYGLHTSIPFLNLHQCPASSACLPNGFIICNIVVVFSFAGLHCPFIESTKMVVHFFLWPGISVFTFISLVFLIGWLIILKPKLSLISAVALLLGIKSIIVFFAFHPHGAFNYAKSPQTIRIVSWNVARFVELKVSNNKGSQKRLKMFEQLKAQNADVLCLQEFHTANEARPEFYDNITPIQKNWVILIIIFF
jgi:hypothetical protein